MIPRVPLRATKLYADLVAPDGTTCVAYLLRLELAGLRRVLGGVEMHVPGSPPAVARALRAEDPDEARRGDGRVEVTMDLPAGTFTLAYDAPSRPARPPGDLPAPGLRWGVEVARSSGTASWHGPGSRELRGEGYADRVSVNGLPCALGLRALLWGRAHGPRGTVVLAGVRSARGGDWRRAAVWDADGSAGETPVWRDAFRLEEAGGGWEATIGGAGGYMLRAGGGRVLRDGPVVDDHRAPRRLEAALLRAVVGPGRQVRRLDPLLDGSGRTGGPTGAAGWLLHERVRFGPRGEGARG